MYQFHDLVEIMAKLRAPDGCPWDREQNFKSLLPYLLEESAEYIEAVENGDINHMCEELGDVLLQVIFHAQIAQENQQFDIAKVIHGISEKMIRRHPHVFGDENAANSDEVLTRWEQIKAGEKTAQSHKKSLLDGVSKSLCALQYAQKIQKKVEKIGFDWNDAIGALSKVHEEIAELEQAITSNDINHSEEELGDLLFSVICVARKLGLDGEMALRRANRKFESRFQKMESYQELAGLSLDQLEDLWQRAKSELKSN